MLKQEAQWGLNNYGGKMDLEAHWQELVQSSVHTHWESLIKETREGIKTLPHYFPAEGNPTFCSPSAYEVFTNILPWTDPVWDDEFARYPGAAVAVDQLAHISLLPQTVREIHLASHLANKPASVAAVLAGIAEDKMVNLGWDLLSGQLHFGQLNRWDRDHFPVEVLKNRPGIVAFNFASEIYSLAGASTVQEVAILLASVVECSRFFSGRLAPEELVAMSTVELSMSPDTLWNISKLQALKLLLARLNECWGVNAEPIAVLAKPSVRYFSAREPWNNLIRQTLMQTAAIIGGARGFRHYPFDVFAKKSFGAGRLSRNSSLILLNESALKSVNNAAEGSGVVAQWVKQICEKSWNCFQEIERKGGLTAALQSGWIQHEVQRSHEHELQRVNTGQRQLIGMNAYVNLDKLSEQFDFFDRENSWLIEDWWVEQKKDSPRSKEVPVMPILPHRLGESFEILQMASDETRKNKGSRPCLYVYCERPETNGEKLKWLRELANTAGFVIVVEKSIKKITSSIACCVGGDPDAESWPLVIEQLRALGYDKIVWVGQKQKEIFSDTWSLNSNKLELCQKMHKWDGGKA